MIFTQLYYYYHYYCYHYLDSPTIHFIHTIYYLAVTLIINWYCYESFRPLSNSLWFTNNTTLKYLCRNRCKCSPFLTYNIIKFINVRLILALISYYNNRRLITVEPSNEIIENNRSPKYSLLLNILWGGTTT